MTGTLPDQPLGLLACAFDAPGLRVSRSVVASRWRGPVGDPTTLAVPAGDTHRAARLQVLRHLLDLRADGRWALQVRPDDASGLLGPRARPLEGPLDWPACVATWPHAVLLRRLFLWVDGRRVDRLLRSRFPGAARDLALDPGPVVPPMWAELDAGVWPAHALDALRLAIALHRHLISNRNRWPAVLNAPPEFSFDLQESASAPSMDGEGTGHWDVPGAGVWTDEAWQHATAVAAAPGRLGPTDEVSTIPQAKTSSPSPSDEAQATLARATSPSWPGAQEVVTRHDEWDCHRQAYLKHWVSVHQRPCIGTDLNFRAEVLARFPSLARRIERPLARISADAPRRRRRLQEGDSVDTDAALDAQVARKMRQAAVDDRVYQARLPQDRDVCVAVLLDTNGSTGYALPASRAAGPSPGGLHEDAQDDDAQDDLMWQAVSRSRATPSPPRSVLDVVKDAAALLCESLQALGDRHAVFAFSGQGRAQVEFGVVKRFDDPWSVQSAAALAGLHARGATRTGAAVRHATHCLRGEPARRKLLIVISDGYPQDQDYGPDRGDIRYGLLDTAHALREAERNGIVAFNLSVDAAANDYLRQICPRNRYAVVDDADALPARMLALFRRMAVFRA